MIGEREIDGFATRTIAGERLEAAFAPAAGMICCSLRDRGTELLGQRHGLRGYVADRSTMGIPLLYPWANRLGRDRFELLGREVDLGAAGAAVKRDAGGLAMHGLLTAASGWEVTAHESTDSGGRLEAIFDWRRGEPAAAFPFPHTVTIAAELGQAELRIGTTVRADASGPVPVAFGFHPYLELAGVPRERWQLELPVGEQLELDARGLPTGARRPGPEPSGALGERSFDDLYLAPDPGTPFALTGGGRRIELRMDGAFPYVQLYAPAGERLLAIEPMTAPTDGLASGGFATVAAGDEFTAAFTVAVADAA